MTKHEHLAAYVECKAAVPGSADSILILFTHEQRDTIVSALRALSPPEPTEPHPRWKPSDKSDRHPQSVEEWDTSKDPIGEALDRSRRRLNVAGDYDDPRAPHQMALVLRGDITRLMHDWIHKNAVFEIWCKEREDARAMPLQDHGNATVRHEDVLSDARSAVQKWADWCHQNEAQWSGWGDMAVPPGATVWREEAEKVLAAFPAMVAEPGTKS